jgi:hypothetical protein
MNVRASARVLFLALLSTYACVAIARSIIAATPEQSARRADYVYDAIVTEVSELRGKGHACGSVYKATVLKVKKGTVAKSLAFGYIGGLRVGTRYRLFLVNDPNGLSMVRRAEEDSGMAEEDVLLFKQVCPPLYTMDRTYFRAIRLGGRR